MDLNNLIAIAEIMKRFGVTRDRVSKIARARGWQSIKIGTANLYHRQDVEAEAERRRKKGLKAY